MPAAQADTGHAGRFGLVVAVTIGLLACMFALEFHDLRNARDASAHIASTQDMRAGSSACSPR